MPRKKLQNSATETDSKSILNIPAIKGVPIIGTTPCPAFQISTEEIIFSIKQQFTNRELALRELGQNSQDAGATSIRVDWRYEKDKLIMEFLDNGCGMDRGIIERHYLRLFDSSKEGEVNKVGHWSLGRLTLLCYEPESIEIITMTAASPGYRLEISCDLSGRLYEMERSDCSPLINSEHGTLVRMELTVATPEEFCKIAEAGNNSIERELAWIRPEVTVTTPVMKEGVIVNGTRRINRPFEIPGRFSKTLTVRLSSGKGEVRCAIGIQPRGTTELSPLTLCCGAIPIERPTELPFTSKGPFALRGVTMVLDSFAFQTNIGRNVVYRDEFLLEFLPAFFTKVAMEYIKAMARLFSQPGGRIFEYLEPLRNLMADVCIKSRKYGFTIPKEVLDAPFIESYVSVNPYSLSNLDNCEGEIYHTSDRPTFLSRRDLLGEESDIVCISLADLPWEFREFLEERYHDRLKKKEASIIVQESDTVGFQEMARALQQRLRPELREVRGIFSFLDRACNDPLAFHQLSVGRFVRFDGVDDTTTPTVMLKSPDRLCLNHNHSHIRNLIRLIFKSIDGQDELAAHFLMRELYFDPALNCSIPQREQLLTADLRHRFEDETGDDLPDDGIFSRIVSGITLQDEVVEI